MVTLKTPGEVPGLARQTDMNCRSKCYPHANRGRRPTFGGKDASPKTTSYPTQRRVVREDLHWAVEVGDVLINLCIGHTGGSQVRGGSSAHSVVSLPEAAECRSFFYDRTYQSGIPSLPEVELTSGCIMRGLIT